MQRDKMQKKKNSYLKNGGMKKTEETYPKDLKQYYHLPNNLLDQLSPAKQH